MDEKNQILDVTYGNFSCRLEGFDDSVETMKIVVSFFHDLAGHNRFMDVAPQAPDMETLARLTEDQAGMSVEAEADGNHVNLRAVKDDIAHETEDDLAEDRAEALSDTDTVEDAEIALDADASVSAKLDRIRAVVDRDAEAAESDDFVEDLSEAEEKPKGLNPLAQRLADLAKRSSQTRVLGASDDYIESDVAKAVEDAVTSTTDDSEDDSSEIEPGFEEIVDDHEDETVSGFDDVDATLEDTLAEADDEDTSADDMDASIKDVAEDQEDDLSDPEQEDEAAQAEEIEETTEAPDDIVAEDADEETDKSQADKTAAKARETSTTLVLTPSDAAEPLPEGVDADKVENATDEDFDLATEVALVEAEIARRQGNEVARHGLSRRVEDAMSRIMSQTDQHLNKPESRRHRDAFAQLKAAVAATEAARQLGDKGEDTPDPDEVFKDDLGAHAAGPSDEDDSDKIRPLDAASERLRQIASTKESAGTPKKTGFAEFADAHGAIELVDLLEAAGAYICFVEGEADFSRPQVMKVVQTASEKEISREDGLRCFGRLLRQTRIIKLPNGRFQVAETSQYRPDDERKAQAR